MAVQPCMERITIKKHTLFGVRYKGIVTITTKIAILKCGAVCLLSDILPENEVFFILCSKLPFGGLNKGELWFHREVATERWIVLPILTDFNISFVKRLPLWGLFIHKTNFFYSCRTSAFIDFYHFMKKE